MAVECDAATGMLRRVGLGVAVLCVLDCCMQAVNRCFFGQLLVCVGLQRCVGNLRALEASQHGVWWLGVLSGLVIV